MNIMKKILSQGSVASAAAATGQTDAAEAEETEPLGLAHLRRQFQELQAHQVMSSETEREERIYMLLPLFCKVRLRVASLVGRG